MLSYTQSGLFVIGAMVLSVVIVLVLNRVWPIRSRKLVNDVTGWQLGILGTTYGVILGFMLFTVWNDFRTAEVNTNLEASSLLTLTRIAKGLPSPERELSCPGGEVCGDDDQPGLAGDAGAGG